MIHNPHAVSRLAKVITQVYTKVATPEGGYLCLGRVDRDDAIAEARAHYERQLIEAQTFLATPPDKMAVAVTRGIYREKIIEHLPPVHRFVSVEELNP